MSLKRRASCSYCSRFFSCVVFTTQGRSQDFRRGGGGGGAEGGGGGVPRSAKEANNPNKRAAELKPRPCAHQGSMFRP